MFQCPGDTFLGAERTKQTIAMFDRGLAWVHFPEGNGGLGLNPKLQQLINERVFGAGGPNAMYRNPIGHGMTGPTVVAWGSEDQKQRYLRPLFTGEEVWCQLFSEPGSGSDFAGLSASNGVKEVLVREKEQAAKRVSLSSGDVATVTVDLAPLSVTYFVVEVVATDVE